MRVEAAPPYAGRRVVLGVSGGIASYKSAWLARLLALAGAEVDVVMTSAAREFIGPITFEALTGRPVHAELWEAGRALDHITLAREADLLVVAPATADFIARAVHGHANDLLSAVLLAATAPVLLVPAMNDRMWAHAQTARNVARARELGYHVLNPDTGPLAAGEGSGPGRMPEPDAIFAHAGRLLERPGLAGRHVVVTAGPTREPLDPIRYLSNQSTGKMGIALAGAAWRRGARVTLIAGPLAVDPPSGVAVQRVETTAEMADAVRHALGDADALVMAAAPADFRPTTVARDKIKKRAAPAALALDPTVDVLRDTRAARPAGLVTVGFALETERVLDEARAKLADKQLDVIVANDATEAGAAFGGDTNRVTIVSRDGRTDVLPLMSKGAVADAILDRVEELLRGR